jgi:hypothetical protein
LVVVAGEKTSCAWTKRPRRKVEKATAYLFFMVLQSYPDTPSTQSNGGKSPDLFGVGDE